MSFKIFYADVVSDAASPRAECWGDNDATLTNRATCLIILIIDSSLGDIRVFTAMAVSPENSLVGAEISFCIAFVEFLISPRIPS